jgi:hypothetical protein
VRAAVSSSSRVYSEPHGPAGAQREHPAQVLDEDLLLAAEAAPIRGLITRMRRMGMPSRGAMIRRTWKGTWVEVRTIRRWSSSSQVMVMCGSIEDCCT